jgi:hypothetical protein
LLVCRDIEEHWLIQVENISRFGVSDRRMFWLDLILR